MNSIFVWLTLKLSVISVSISYHFMMNTFVYSSLSVSIDLIVVGYWLNTIAQVFKFHLIVLQKHDALLIFPLK